MSHDRSEHGDERAELADEPVEQLALPLPQPEASAPQLAAYSESDDAPTRFFETPHPPPSWLVQLTPFDRRLMSRDALFEALHEARLDARTLVWRQGMSNWQPIAELEELGYRAYRPRPAARRGSAASRWVIGLCGASALAALGSTLFVLSAAGVFTSPLDTQREAPHLAPGPSALAAALEPQRVLSAITPASARGSAGDQVQERDEQRAAEDRPQDREGPAIDVHRQQLRQVQVARQEHTEERAEEADDDRDQEAAARSPAQRTPNRAANARNDQQQQ